MIIHPNAVTAANTSFSCVVDPPDDHHAHKTYKVTLTPTNPITLTSQETEPGWMQVRDEVKGLLGDLLGIFANGVFAATIGLGQFAQSAFNGIGQPQQQVTIPPSWNAVVDDTVDVGVEIAKMYGTATGDHEELSKSCSVPLVELEQNCPTGYTATVTVGGTCEIADSKADQNAEVSLTLDWNGQTKTITDVYVGTGSQRVSTKVSMDGLSGALAHADAALAMTIRTYASANFLDPAKCPKVTLTITEIVFDFVETC